MNSWMEVHLQKIKIYAFHGLVPGEEILGGEFEVNLTVSYKPDSSVIKKIEDTVNYTVLLQIVKERMQKPNHLLETVATEIAGEIIERFPIVAEVFVSISKLNPPIENFEGSVAVSFKIKRD